MRSSPIEIFGAAAAAGIAGCYALEPRHPRYTGLFRAACLAAAGYAVAIGSWPFATVETFWARVAWRRYRARFLSEGSANR